MQALQFHRLTDTLARFLRWWTAELRAFLPSSVEAWGRPPVRVILSPDGLSLGKRCAVPIAGPEWTQILKQLQGISRDRDSIRIDLVEPLCLVQETTIPSAAARRAGEILALRLEQTTPFRRADVCLGWKTLTPPPDPDHVVLRYAVVKRALLAPLLGDVLSAGFARASACFVTPDGETIDIRLPRELAQNRSLVLRLLAWFDRCCVGMVVAAGVGALVLLNVRQQAELDRLDVEIAQVQRTATEVRSVYDAALLARRQIDDLDQASRNAPRLVSILEEVSRLVSDDAWLTDMQLDHQALRLTGFARSAPELIAALDASELFNDVAFTSPVVRAPREAADRFNISLKLASPAMPQGGLAAVGNIPP